jgi:hypothetical protein
MSRDSEETANRALSESREAPALLQERKPLDLRETTKETQGDPADSSTWALMP